ncbi:MAG TPA: hypothetical protein VK578_12525 [Edaphobacter sp.]|nr:hypothetical protein [Edaphobacter sp.]
MGSIREAVLVSGTLKGMNQQVPCMVRAVKVSLLKLDIWEYVAANIVQAPSELPDGGYDVSFEGRSMKVRKIAGSWEPAEA